MVASFTGAGARALILVGAAHVVSSAPSLAPTELNRCLENVTDLTFDGYYEGENQFLLGDYSYVGMYPHGYPYFELRESLSGATPSVPYYLHYKVAPRRWMISTELGSSQWLWRTAYDTTHNWPTRYESTWQVNLGPMTSPTVGGLEIVPTWQASMHCPTTPAPSPSVLEFCDSIRLGGTWEGDRDGYFGHYALAVRPTRPPCI